MYLGGGGGYLSIYLSMYTSLSLYNIYIYITVKNIMLHIKNNNNAPHF